MQVRSRCQGVFVRERPQFITNVSHELRTPVTTISLYAHLMREHPEQRRQCLTTLAQEAELQARLAENVVQVS